MDNRKWQANSSASPPAAEASPSTGYPSDGNPGTATPATVPGAAWFHQIGEELRAVLVAAGLTPSDTNLTQLAVAIQSGKMNAAANIGTADALAATYAPVVATLGAGMTLLVRAAAANTTTAPTFSPNGLPAKTIVKGADAVLAPDDIAGAGYWVELQYDATLDKWVMQNPATGVNPRLHASIKGGVKNLLITTTGTNANVSVSADEVALENAANNYATVRAVNLTIDTASAGANGLDTGTLAASTWYAVWVIRKDDGTTAGLISLSATAPTLPAGYTFAARVGYIRTDGTANKYPLSLRQVGRTAHYKVASGSNVTGVPIMAIGVAGDPTVPTFVAVAVGNFVPPTAGKIAVLNNSYTGAGIDIVAPNNQYGDNQSTTNPCPIQTTNNGCALGVLVLESTNIYWASNGSSHLLACIGWEDNL